MSATLPLPKSKNALLAAVDNLSYTQRFNYASRLGRDHKADPNLKALVDDLLLHPEPPVPEMEAEEGFTEILPAQRTTISKYYNEDQIALAIAVSAGYFETIKERLTSPSTFFDSLIISNYIRMKDNNWMEIDQHGGSKPVAPYMASDKEVVQAIMDAVPARRRLLIQESIQAKRLSIIETVVPLLLALPNYPYSQVGHIIHACSPETVKEFLRKNLYKNAGQVWNKLLKLHIDSVLDVFEEQLKSVTVLSYSSIWSTYMNWAFSSLKGVKRVLKNKKALVRIMELSQKFPVTNFLSSNSVPHPVVKEGHNPIDLPDFITSNLGSFVRASPTHVTQLLKTTVYLRFDNRVLLSSNCLSFLQSNSVHLSFESINEVIKHLLNTTPKNTPFVPRMGAEADLFSSFHSTWPSHWTGRQVITVTKMILQWMDDHPSSSHYYANQLEEIRYLFANTMRFFQGKMQSLYGTSAGDKIQKRAKLTKRLEKNRKLFTEAFNLYWPYQEKYIGTQKSDRDEDVKRIIKQANLYVDSYAQYLLSDDVESTTTALEKAKSKLLILAESKPTNDIYNTRQNEISSIYSFIRKVINKLDVVIAGPIVKEDADKAQKTKRSAFMLVKDLLYSEVTPSDVTTQFLSWDVNLTYEIFFPILKEDKFKNISYIMEVFNRLSSEQKLDIYKLLDKNDQEHLVQTRSTLFLQMVKALPQETINEIVVHLLSNPKLVDENTRNTLVSFQDIKEATVRTSLQKMTNSSNIVERNGALTSLIIATARAHDKTQTNRTLKFIREKIKNETQENRASVLQLISSEGKVLLKKEFLQEEQRAFWFNMLEDAFASQDLDENVYDKSTFYNHPVLQHFESIGKSTITSCVKKLAKDFETDLFEFGVELLWKLNVFRHGEKKAAADFKIPFPANGSFQQQDIDPVTGVYPVSNIAPYVSKVYNAYTAAYEKRISEKNPNWKTDFSYVQDFFNITPKWWEVTEFIGKVKEQIERVKAEAKKDDDGLYLIEPGDAIRAIAEKALPTGLDFAVEENKELVDLVMKSRLIAKYIKYWVASKELNAKTARDFKLRRDQYIPELLKITPSAIHLRFVWRHLVTYQQNLLDDYIGKRKTFRGVFYVGPDKRKFDRSCLKTPKTRQAGGRTRAAPAGKARKATSAGVINDRSDESQEKIVEEERAKEKEIEDELEGVPLEQRDHEDFFYLEACYGLRRLLPRQVNILAKDWQVQILSSDRSIPYKVKVTARWTVMPTVTYNDIVVFLNANEAATETSKGLPVNLIEALLRGVMRNDEPTAPLNFLLSPKFLGSDRSRVSVYAISQSVPYMPADGLTNMLRLCLTGKRRFSLKVSAYKEIIRLLASQPSETHLNMILHEWKRPELHRDIRLAIVHTAFEFLESKSEKFHEVGFQILEGAAKMEDQHEILTAVLGVRRAENDIEVFVSSLDNCLRNKRIGEVINEMSKHNVSHAHAERFGEKVVAVAAKTAKNDDVRFIATSTLFRWPAYSVAIETALAYMKDWSAESLLYSNIKAERRIYQSRWENLQSLFVDYCTIKSTYFAPEKVLDLIAAVRAKILSCPREDRQQRMVLLTLMERFLQKIRVCENMIYNTYPEDFEGKLVSLFQGVVSPKLLFDRRLTAIQARAYKNQDTLKLCLDFLHDLTSYCSSHPAIVDGTYLSLLNSLMSYRGINLTTLMSSVLELKIDAKNNPVSSTPEYLYLLRLAALQMLNYCSSFAATYPEQAIQFWRGLFNFASERKDVPREHTGESKSLSFSALAENIKKCLQSGRIVKHSPHSVYYSEGVKKIISTFASGYKQVLQGKSEDAFTKWIAENIVIFFDNIIEAESADSIFEIAHPLLLSLPKTAYTLIPLMFSTLRSCHRESDAINLLWNVIENSLVKKIDVKTLSPEYIRFSRAIGINLLQAAGEVGRKDDVVKFIDVVVPVIPSLVGQGTLFNSEDDVISSILSIVKATSKGRHNITEQGSKMARKFIGAYTTQPVIGTEGFGAEQKIVRDIALYFISTYPIDLIENNLEALPKVINKHFLEVSGKDVVKTEIQNQVCKLFSSLAKHKGADSPAFISVLHDLVNLSLAPGQKDKKYIEVSFDVALKVYQEFQSLLISDTQNTLKFINWAISMYIYEPDMHTIRNALKHILTSTAAIVKLTPKENQISLVANIISDIIDLKHKNLVLPQQTVLPLQAYPQYSHVNYYLALSMVNDFGNFFRIEEDHKFVWDKTFVDLLERFTKVNDPEIVHQSWKVETEFKK